MRKVILVAMFFVAFIFSAGVANADPFAYPCQYPGVGFGVEIVGISGQFCDYPTEVNGTHWHCESGGFRTGGVGLATGNGVSLGAISSLGASGNGCSFRCPDGTVAPSPNEVGAWKGYIVPRLTFCREHAIPNGPTSALVDVNEGLHPAPEGIVQPGLELDIPDQQPPGLVEPNSEQPQPNPGTFPIPEIPEIPLPGIPAIPLPQLP